MAEQRPKGLKVAIEGCCHGELDKIYQTMQALERKQNVKIDLLICCGDFQAVRNLDDLECLACPRKYRALNTFWKYYTGRAVAPYPTLFIGGNHEAANYLWELYHGGWVAPNIWYLGHAGVINFGGIRIGGLSGIFNPKHYRMGYYEHPPYTLDSVRSAYHVRELEVYRLLQLKGPLDIFLSHDWPRGIAHYGLKDQLFRKKPFLRDEVESNTLGSPPAEQLLKALRPSHWFSAHLHVKYAALYPHETADAASAAAQNGDQPQEQQGSAGGGPASSSQAENGEARGSFTRFLALDKCLPHRPFLQVVEFPDAEGPLEFAYDEEWLGILRTTHPLISLTRRQPSLPGMGGWRGGATDEDRQFIQEALAKRGGPAVPSKFTPTASGHDPSSSRQQGRMPQHAMRNPQTEQFFELIGRPYSLDHSSAAATSAQHSAANSMPPPPTAAGHPEEIDLDDVADNAEEISLPDEAGDVDESPPDQIVDDPMFTPVDINNSYQPAFAAMARQS